MNAPQPDQPPVAPQQPIPAQGPAYPPNYSYPTGQPYPVGHVPVYPPSYKQALPPAVSPGGLPLASFAERLGAYLIDGLVLGGALMLVSVPILVALLTVLPEQLDPDDPSIPMQTVIVVIMLEAALFAVMLMIAYLYHVEVMRRSGQTLGKKAMKLRVIPLDPTVTLSRRMCFLRYLIQFVAAAFVPFFSWFDGLWQLGDKPFQQCLHDKVAQTVVVKVSAR